MNAGLTFILGLTLTGILPALAIAGVTPVCIFYRLSLVLSLRESLSNVRSVSAAQ